MRYLIITIFICICLIYIYNIYNNICYKYYKHRLEYNDYDILINNLENYMNEKMKEILPGKLQEFPQEINYVCSAGAFFNLIAAGSIIFLQKLNIKIIQYAGCSAGSQVSYICLNKCHNEGMKWAFSVGDTLSQYKYIRHEPMWDFFREISPKLPIPEPGKLTCSMTVISKWYKPWNMKNIHITSYNSHSDVGESVLVSAAIPWLFMKNIVCKYRNMLILDGGLTEKTPIFKNSKRPQIITDWNKKVLPNKFKKIKTGLFVSSNTMYELFKYGVDVTVDLINNIELKNECIRLQKTVI